MSAKCTTTLDMIDPAQGAAKDPREGKWAHSCTVAPPTRLNSHHQRKSRRFMTTCAIHKWNSLKRIDPTSTVSLIRPQRTVFNSLGPASKPLLMYAAIKSGLTTRVTCDAGCSWRNGRPARTPAACHGRQRNVRLQAWAVKHHLVDGVSWSS